MSIDPRNLPRLQREVVGWSEVVTPEYPIQCPCLVFLTKVLEFNRGGNNALLQDDATSANLHQTFTLVLPPFTGHLGQCVVM